MTDTGIDGGSNLLGDFGMARGVGRFGVGHLCKGIVLAVRMLGRKEKQILILNLLLIDGGLIDHVMVLNLG